MKTDTWKKLGMDLAKAARKWHHGEAPGLKETWAWELPDSPQHNLCARAKALRARDRKSVKR